MAREVGQHPGKARRFPPALVLDLPVLVMLVVCSLTVSIRWAHLATGLALVVVVALHLATRRRRVRRLFRHPRPVTRRRVSRRLGYWLFLVAATAMTVTGLLRWAGVPPQYVWHGGVGYLLLGLATIHLWTVRRALLARFRRPRIAQPHRGKW